MRSSRRDMLSADDARRIALALPDAELLGELLEDAWERKHRGPRSKR